VDGGGTKTAFALARADGALVGTAEGAGSDYVSHGFDAVRQTLRVGLEECLGQAGIGVGDLAGAVFGLPCHGENPADTARLDRLGADLVGGRRSLCVNDMVCGWAGSLGLADGVNVVAGTGSMAYGRRAGSEARCGGWGEIVGDEGSAFWIGRRLLALFSHMSDGRTPRGALYEIVRSRVVVGDTDLEVVPRFVAGAPELRRRVAALAPAAAEAALAGDEGAADILRVAGRELARLARASAMALGYSAGEAIRVSYSGGVFGAGPVLGSFRSALTNAGSFTVTAPVTSPVFGALAYAAREFGEGIDLAALARADGRRRGVPG
ncbi:MAG TPA: BadF/BadG/BcrA/BcrD ATPase family protein, partial [Microbacteriaceae bacterium]|nr:BadF/BadG/BcrA/BcrD ATPase family protein [Microbacteriaceae bacterium]